MEALGRFELPTRGLGNRCSIHLSYRAVLLMRSLSLAVLGIGISAAGSRLSYGLAHARKPPQFRKPCSIHLSYRARAPIFNCRTYK